MYVCVCNVYIILCISHTHEWCSALEGGGRVSAALLVVMRYGVMLCGVMCTHNAAQWNSHTGLRGMSLVGLLCIQGGWGLSTSQDFRQPSLPISLFPHVP